MSLTDTSEKYAEPRAHELRDRYLLTFGGEEIPVPVESIAEDLLGLRIEQCHELGDLSGVLLPTERLIRLNASEAVYGETPIRRHRYTIAHELGHWICHVLAAPVNSEPAPSYCRAADLARDADRSLEREANIFAAELLMPEAAVRAAWDETFDIQRSALRFDVSASAMHWRLYAFGHVAEGPK